MIQICLQRPKSGSNPRIRIQNIELFCVYSISDLGVGVTHHSDEKVEEEKEDDEYEEEPVYAANVLVVGVAEALPHDEGVAGRHHEDHHDALHCARHRVLLQAV